jgi:protein involved in polysaccharide export with SLBB domain
MRRLLVLALAASAPACSWAEAPPLAQGNVEARVVEAAAPRVVLGPGDLVSVQVFLHPENSSPETGLRIDAEGRIDLPLLGPIVLAGLSPDEARAKLVTELGRYLREPQVSFNVLQLGGRRFYIFGEMERPGAFSLDRPLTALQALTSAGGFRPGADRKHVALLRGTREHLEVYFFDGATPGPDGLVTVQPDDFLFVRLSGAGTFRDQLLPIVQSIVPPITGLASLIVVADQLNN